MERFFLFFYNSTAMNKIKKILKTLLLLQSQNAKTLAHFKKRTSTVVTPKLHIKSSLQ